MTKSSICSPNRRRAAATPRTAAAQYNYILRSLDVRQALPLIQVPTLVLHVRDSPFIPIEHGRYLAEHIDGATFVELPGGDVVITPDSRVIADEVAEFLTGERPMRRNRASPHHGALHRYRGVDRTGRLAGRSALAALA